MAGAGAAQAHPHANTPLQPHADKAATDADTPEVGTGQIRRAETGVAATNETDTWTRRAPCVKYLSVCVTNEGSHIRTHRHTHTHTRMHTHTHTYTYIHTHTHTHKRTEGIHIASWSARWSMCPPGRWKTRLAHAAPRPVVCECFDVAILRLLPSKRPSWRTWQRTVASAPFFFATCKKHAHTRTHTHTHRWQIHPRCSASRSTCPSRR